MAKVYNKIKIFLQMSMLKCFLNFDVSFSSIYQKYIFLEFLISFYF